MAPMKRALAAGLAFYVAVAILLRLASGSWHVAVHGGLYVAAVFTMWIESRLSR